VDPHLDQSVRGRRTIARKKQRSPMRLAARPERYASGPPPPSGGTAPLVLHAGLDSFARTSITTSRSPASSRDFFGTGTRCHPVPAEQAEVLRDIRPLQQKHLAVAHPGDAEPLGPLSRLGPAMAGRTVRLDAGLRRFQVLLDGFSVKTVPSCPDARDLARLMAAGASPAGPPPPLPPASGDAIEVQRTVNASGNVSLADHMISAGLPLAGRRITVRLDGPVAHVISGGVLARTVACPVHAEARPRLRLARTASTWPAPLARPADGKPTSVGARGHYGRQAEDPGWAGPRRPDRRSYRPVRHLPDHRRTRRHHFRAQVQ
jgi:hypothetical protein